ncbi:MAG: hypothetical protein HYZ31_06485 [Gammaproteobacteria bacterium]|nr:hypothetical protein [Gammaproteobacteria bacterium]
MADETNPNHLPATDNNEGSTLLHGQVALLHSGYQIDMSLMGAMDVTNYSSDEIPDTTAAQLNMDMLWMISPSQFEWYLGDVFMQTAIDSTSNITPGNQQDINAYSTGPNYIIRLDRRSKLLFQARVNDYYYENVDTDNYRYIGVTRFEYDISSTLNSVAGYEHTNIRYDNNIDNIDYIRNDAFVSVNHHKHFYEAEILVGSTQISRYFLEDLLKPRFSLSVQNRRSWTTDIRFVYLTDLSDASNDIFSIDDHFTQNADFLLSSISSLYNRKTIALDLTKSITSGQIVVSLRQTSADYYDDDTLDQIVNRGTVTYEFSASPRSRVAMNIIRQNTEYTERLVPRTDDDTLASINYVYSASRQINISARVETSLRESTSASDNYDNNRIMFSVEYISN